MRRYDDNTAFTQAIERGERFQSGHFVHGFGVRLPRRGMLHLPEEPVTRKEAERLRALLAASQHPDAVVVRMALDIDAVTETQERAPEDLYTISFFFAPEPGSCGRQTDLIMKPYEEALAYAEQLKAKGFVAVQINCPATRPEVAQ